MNYKLITFDVFSALGDIQGTFIPLLNEMSEFNGKDTSALFGMWRGKQYEYMVVHNSLDREFMSFEEITRRTLDYTLHVNEVELSKEKREQLVKTWRKINFWDDAAEVVAEVKKKGYLIGMLSNGDTDMLEELQERLGISFDYLFSAEQIQTYKPSPKMYDLPYTVEGLKKGDYLHVAGSPIDIVGSISAGIPCAWSNRKNDVPLDLSFKPTYNLQNLKEFLALFK